MANRDEKEKDLDSFNIGLDSILEQYEVLPRKERDRIVKGLKKEKKAASKHWMKTNDGRDEFKIRRLEQEINILEGQTEKIPIQYAMFKFHIKKDYLQSIKDKEQYLDGLFHKKMQRIFKSTTEVRTGSEANELQSLLTVYDKKIKDSKFYNENSVFEAIEKLTKFRNEKLTDWEYSDYVKEKLGMEVKESQAADIYAAVQSPLLLGGKLVGISFNFF